MSWLWALGAVLLVEGLGPLLFPKLWQAMMGELSRLDINALRRLGGCLVTSGLVLLYIFSA